MEALKPYQLFLSWVKRLKEPVIPSPVEGDDTTLERLQPNKARKLDRYIGDGYQLDGDILSNVMGVPKIDEGIPLTYYLADKGLLLPEIKSLLTEWGKTPWKQRRKLVQAEIKVLRRELDGIHKIELYQIPEIREKRGI